MQYPQVYDNIIIHGCFNARFKVIDGKNYNHVIISIILLFTFQIYLGNLTESTLNNHTRLTQTLKTDNYDLKSQQSI